MAIGEWDNGVARSDVSVATMRGEGSVLVGLLARSLAGAVALALVAVAPAGAADTTDASVLDAVVKDLGLTLLAKPSESAIKLPLSPRGWSLLGRVTPYASMSPRVFSPGVEDLIGLAAPMREPTDELSKGLGVGAGLNWHLSEWIEVFGEYQLFSVRGRGVQTEGSLGHREMDSPTLKGGFSIRF